MPEGRERYGEELYVFVSVRSVQASDNTASFTHSPIHARTFNNCTAAVTRPDVNITLRDVNLQFLYDPTGSLSIRNSSFPLFSNKWNEVSVVFLDGEAQHNAAFDFIQNEVSDGHPVRLVDRARFILCIAVRSLN